jgi:Trypsin-like peptidase domain
MRAIPDDNLAYPVLIVLDKGGTGSGFYLTDGNCLYLVTARHVLFDAASGALQDSSALLRAMEKTRRTRRRRSLLSTCRNYSLTISALMQRGMSRSLGSRRHTKSVSLPLGVTKTAEAKSGIVLVPTSSIRRFADVMVANQVVTFGYPVSLGLKNLPQIDYERPLLRRGIIAGKNEANGTIVLDCPLYPGNSGGLVLEAETEGLGMRFHAIGIVSQYVPAVQPWFDAGGKEAGKGLVNSGYSIASPMDVAIDLIKQLPALR